MLKIARTLDRSIVLRLIDMGGPEATLLSSPSVRQVVAFRLRLGSGSPLLQVLCYVQK